MIRIFYLDTDPEFYSDLLCWLPDYCSLHKLSLKEMESNKIPFKWESDIVLINPDFTGHNCDFLTQLIQNILPVPVIFISDTADLPFVSSLIRCGAYMYLNKKEDKSILIESIKNILYDIPESTNEELIDSLPEIVGSSKEIKKLKKEILNLSSSSMHVHITGESGTGKELAARALHKCRIGHKKHLLTLNCGAIAENLVESELFGTKKGAFTDAIERAGFFETAHGSTLMLDEVCELTKQAQVKLLRVLEYGTFNRVGGYEELKSDFNLITATNKNLKREVEKGNFREDLFYRITSLILQIPPLRERSEDIGVLSRHFLSNLSSRKTITADAMRKMRKHNWPGNIRELKQVIERADHFARKKTTIEDKHIVFY